MPNVTVVGADNTVLTLSVDGVTNYQLAQQFAALVNTAAGAGTLTAAALAPDLGVPAVPAGNIGEAMLATPLAAVTVPGGYSTLLDVAKGPATVYAGSGTAPVSVLSAAGGLTFNAGPGQVMFAAAGATTSSTATSRQAGRPRLRAIGQPTSTRSRPARATTPSAPAPATST